MINRTLLSVAAVIVAAVTLGACGSDPGPGPGPFGNNDKVPNTQCTPLAGHPLVSDGLQFVQNPTDHTATITRVSLRKDHGLVLVRAWAVPTSEQIYGVAYGQLPPTWEVLGWRWADRQHADGAKVVPTTGKYDRLNLVLVVKLAPGKTRGRTGGVNVTYMLGGHKYLIPFRTALVVVAGSRCPSS